MLNFFKNLFGSGETETHSNGNGYATAAPPPVPVQVQARPVPSVPQPAVQRPAPVSHARPVSNGQGVQIPLYTIIAILPLELKTRIRETMVADVFVSFPLDRVLTQLGAGAVKITFGELRALVPNVFLAQSNLDSTEIMLPLNEILPQINPELIARRHSQRQVQIPDDVNGPFGNGLSGVTLADPRSNVRPSAPPSAARTPAPIPPSDEAPIFTRETKLPPAPAPAMRPVTPVRPAAPIPFTPPAPAAAAAPIPFRSSIASTPTPRPPTAVPSVSPPVRPVLPAARGVGATPLPTATPRLPSNGNGRPPVPIPVPVPHAPQVAPIAPIAMAPAAPVAPEVYLNVPLAVLTETWPEVLHSEIEQLHLSEAHLALPMRIIEPALKQGKINFPWKVLRSWIRPATLPTVSAHDGMMLELPLRVIAPLFIARQKQGSQAQQQKVKVNDNIPNLFFGFPQGDSAAAAIEAPATPVATPPPAFAPAPEEPETNFAPAPKGATDTNFYVWGETDELPQIDQSAVKRTTPGTDFLTRYATPNEVVARASALEGVVGALVALPDGLMVASKLSADLNGDTLAAFLPHIFGKVSQCTKELRMGELNNLHFTVGNVPWKIFRVNAIFFAAFGNAGQPLPTAQLAALAAQLDRKK